MSIQQTIQNLLPIELLPATIFFDHHVRNFVDPLIGSEALFALFTHTLAAAADGIALTALPGINDAVLNMAAKWTLQISVWQKHKD